MKKITLTLFCVSVLLGSANSSAQSGVGFGTTNPQALIHMENGHLKSTQTGAPATPTPTAVNGLSISGGTFPTIVNTGTIAVPINTPVAPPTDVRGTIALPGSGVNATSSAIVTFATPYNVRPTVILTTASANGAALDASNIHNLYAVTTATGFTINLFTSNNTIGTIFNINYLVIE